MKRYLGMIRQSSKSSSYKIEKIHTNDFKVKKKRDKLLETDNPEPIIKKIKSLSYIEKILESMNNAWLLLNDEKIRRKDNVIIELEKRRRAIKRQLIEEEKQEEIAINKEELTELITKLERLETKLKKLRANKPHYIPELMENNSGITREKLENAKKILANPLDVRYLEGTIYNIKQHIDFKERIIKELKEQVCSRILTPKQVGFICWFMAIFVAMFYSQRNRKVLLKVSKRWDTTDALFTSLKGVLDDKYLMSENEEKDYEQFSDDTFGDILKLLFKKDSKSFPYNPDFKGGFLSEVYICKLYNLLGVDCEMFDYMILEDSSKLLTYSYLNKEYDVIDYKFEAEKREIKRAIKKGYEKLEYIVIGLDTYYTKNKSTQPTILIIRVVNADFVISGNLIYDKKVFNELTSMREEIKYNGKTYILDSVILTNWNERRHAIAGITCKGIKYIYNGWEREETTQYFPCGLQQHDWKVKDGNDFCLNTRTCRPDILKERLANEWRLCFNFSEGNRMLIYVLKDKHLEKINKAATAATTATTATAATTLHATIRRSVAQKEHLEKLRKAETLHATIRRSVAQKEHLEKLNKAANAATTLQATIRRRRSVA